MGKSALVVGLNLAVLCGVLSLIPVEQGLAGAGDGPPEIRSDAEVDESSVEGYVKFLKSKDAKTRSMAAIALKSLRFNPESKKAIISLLLEALKDPDPQVRASILSTSVDLSNVYTNGNMLEAHIINALQDPDSRVRIVAVRSLGNRGKHIPYLIAALKDSDEEVKYNASLALKNSFARRSYSEETKNGYLAETKALEKQAATELAKLLKNSDERLRSSAIETLGEMDSEAKGFVSEFIIHLKDPSKFVRAQAAVALGSFLYNKDYYDPLEEFNQVNRSNGYSEPYNFRGLEEFTRKLFLLKDPEDSEIKKIIPALIDTLKDTDNDVQDAAATAIGKAGKAAKIAIPVLITALKAPDDKVRQNAARALGRIKEEGKEAIPALTTSLQDSGLEVRLDSAIALSQIDVTSKMFVPILLAALQEKDERITERCIESLTDLALEVEEIIPALIEASKNKDKNIHKNATIALDKIFHKVSTNAEGNIDKISGTELKKEISILENILKTLSNSEHVELSEGISLVLSWKQKRETLNLLKAKRDYLFWTRMYQLLQSNPLLCAGFVVPVGYLLIFGLRPRWLLLLPTEITIPKVGVKLPLGIIKWLKYRPRVLDAWVSGHLLTARDSFSKLETVQQRQVHVALPLPASLTLPTLMDGKTYPELCSAALQPIFAAREFCVLIYGDGGTGKTSLVCQIGQWVMVGDTKQRPSPYPMLPVLIEQDFDPDVEKGKQLLSAIKGRLERLIQATETIPDELLDQLLRQRRLLVIIDHFSELTKDTQQAIKPGAPNFPAKALIITSRVKEELDQVQKTTIALPRISDSAGHLTVFLENYLKAKQHAALFNAPADQIEFNTHCNRLISMASTRGVTVLLAKLYAELMVAQKSGTLTNDLPATIPGVMLSYLNELNSGSLEKVFSNHILQQDAQVIAWACLQATYRPKSIQRDAAISLLGGNNAGERLSHLENRLQLLQPVGFAKEQVRFMLDPLAEYLAGWHLVKVNGNDENAWQEFFHHAHNFNPEEIQGFIQAVEDCYRANSVEGEVTGAIINQLTLAATKATGMPSQS